MLFKNVTLTRPHLANFLKTQKVKQTNKKHINLVCFEKLLHPRTVQLIKTNLLPAKLGHFDLVYCSVLKPLACNS